MADQRIPDDGDFVVDIKALAQKVSEKYNVSMCELRSGGRRRAVVQVRRAISWIGVREVGYSGADVARYLGVTNSCVTRMKSVGRKEDRNEKIKALLVTLET
ncbi:MAG: hypothetical protein JXD19_08685 [Deltaproteobacteria bacterium]|nr:hypothetical protein [Deltaproteobacteria bacterium]